MVFMEGVHELFVRLENYDRPRPDQASFFELRDRLVESKFFDMGLNISNIYHVFGRCQDRFTLEEANVAQVKN